MGSVTRITMYETIESLKYRIVSISLQFDIGMLSYLHLFCIVFNNDFANSLRSPKLLNALNFEALIFLKLENYLIFNFSLTSF